MNWRNESPGALWSPSPSGPQENVALETQIETCQIGEVGFPIRVSSVYATSWVDTQIHTASTIKRLSFTAIPPNQGGNLPIDCVDGAATVAILIAWQVGRWPALKPLALEGATAADQANSAAKTRSVRELHVEKRLTVARSVDSLERMSDCWARESADRVAQIRIGGPPAECPDCPGTSCSMWLYVTTSHCGGGLDMQGCGQSIAAAVVPRTP